MQPFRFLLYCLSALAGFVGFSKGVGPLWDYFYHTTLFPSSFTYSVDELYRSAVITFLSLILLILVHLGHRLAGAFDVGLSKKPPAPEPPDKLIV
jgi:hypothetical protein